MVPNSDKISGVMLPAARPRTSVGRNFGKLILQPKHAETLWRSYTCSGCQDVGDLAQCLLDLKEFVSEKYRCHLTKRIDRLRRFIGHLLRCAVQQTRLETLPAEVARNREGSFGLIILDFKV